MPYIVLHEVAGGTSGSSAEKVRSNLLKLARGMKKHLRWLGGSADGTSFNDAWRLRVCGVQYIANYAYSQAMCALAPDVYVMWEWSEDILPRSLSQMHRLRDLISSVYTMKRSTWKARPWFSKRKQSPTNTGQTTGIILFALRRKN